MIASLTVLLVIFVGLGGLMPAMSTKGGIALGYRTFAGFCVAIVLEYCGAFIFRLGIDVPVFIIVALAGIGLVRLAVMVRRDHAGQEVWLHPVPLFLLAVIVVGIVHGDIIYHPMAGDTLSNWLIPAKTMWLAGDPWRPDIANVGEGYVPGWHLLLAFPASIWGAYDNVDVIAMPAAIHIALLGFVYDIVRHWCVAECGSDARSANLVGFLFLLIALAGEVSWRLVPPNLLSEVTLFHTAIGLVLLGSLYWHRDASAFAVTLTMGLAVCAHYLVKKTGMVLIPIGLAMAILGLAFNRVREKLPFSRLAFYVALAALPVLGAFAAWNMFGVPSGKCIGDIEGVILTGSDIGLLSEPALVQMRDLLMKTGTYFIAYKTPLVVMATIGLIAGLLDFRLIWVSIAVAGYCLIFLVAVHLAYLLCPGSFNYFLSSLQRYLQVPVRLFHFMGFFILAMLVCREWFSRFGAKLSRTMMISGVCALVLLGSYQTVAIERSFFRIETQSDEGDNRSKFLVYARRIPVEAEAILKLARERGIEVPRVLVVQVFWEATPYRIALLAALPRRRADLPGDGSISRMWLHSLLLKTPEAVPKKGAIWWSRLHSRPSGMPENLPNIEEDPTAVLREFDVIWATGESVWLKSALAPLLDDAACLGKPSDYFILRDNTGKGRFACLPRR